MLTSAADRELVRRIRTGDERAWQDCISAYEGRLQAFVNSRLKDASLAEDLVQETFLGFLTALPNYDDATPVESFLFAIATHKITDMLRKLGRRPAMMSATSTDDAGNSEPRGRDRMASSMARSREESRRQAQVIAACLRGLIQQWFTQNEFQRLECAELLFVADLPNKTVTERLGISEQDVANHKQFILNKLKSAARSDSPQSDFQIG